MGYAVAICAIRLPVRTTELDRRISFLLYGRDPQLLTETVLYPPVQREPVLLDDYKSSMMRAMSDAWEAARQNVRKAQKIQHDRSARNADFHVGDRVFVYMPTLKSGPAYKLACPYKGPYRVLELFPNGADIILVDRPGSTTIRVALNRLRRCPVEMGSENFSDPCNMKEMSIKDDQADSIQDNSE